LPPQPPIKPTLFAKIGYEDHLKTVYEEVINPEDPDGPKMKRAKRVSETVVRCKVSVTYKSYWLPPKTHYEVRIRAMKSSEWRTERTQATHKMITGLDSGTTYEVQIRAKSIAGWSDFCEVVTVSTPNAKKEEGEGEEKEEVKKASDMSEEEKQAKEVEERKARRKASIL